MTSSRRIRLTDDARADLRRLAASPKEAGRYKQVRKTLELMSHDLRHPSLRTHKYQSLVGPAGEEVFEAYAQNQTPGAYRVFFCYGPDEQRDGARIPILTIIAILPHPQ